jgi:large subunit ribosomal protein L25
MDVELSVRMRSKVGKGAARVLRGEERVPAVLYGPKTEPILLSVEAKRLEKLLRDAGEESRLLRLSVEGDEENRVRQALIREVQVHPYRKRFLHVDFYEVPLDQPIMVEVPVDILGEALCVKKGGVVNLVRRTLTVRCLPGAIPEKIHIDVSELDIGSAVHVGDLRESFELIDDAGITVVNVTAPEGKGKEEESAGE